MHFLIAVNRVLQGFFKGAIFTLQCNISDTFAGPADMHDGRGVHYPPMVRSVGQYCFFKAFLFTLPMALRPISAMNS